MEDAPVIPATDAVTIPAAAETVYDQWTPASISITRTGPGASRVDVRAVRSRVANEAGDTELSPRPEDAVSLAVADLYAPASDEYPAGLRAAVLAAAAPNLAAVSALMDRHGVR